jgi:hypothetical protein
MSIASMMTGFRPFGLGGNSTSPSPSDQQNNSQNNQQNNKQTEPDPTDVDITKTNFWAQPQNNQNQNNQNNNNQNNQNNNTNQNQNNNSNNNNNQQNAQAAFDAYLDSLGLGVQITPEALAKFKDEGDFSGVADALGKSNKNLYSAMMKDVARLVQAGTEKAVSTAMQQFSTRTATSNLISQMNKALPFTENPNIAPVAQAVLNQAMKTHGGDADKAIGMVKGFFSSMSRVTAKDLGLNTNQNGPGSNRFGGNVVDDNDNTDWMKFLSGED